MSASSSAPCTAGRIHDGADQHQPAAARPPGARWRPRGDRDGPAQLALGLAPPGGQLRRGCTAGGSCSHSPACTPSAARRCATSVVQLVDPVVQRPDPVGDLGARGAAGGTAPRAFVVAHARHGTRSRRSVKPERTLVRDARDHVARRGRGPRRAGPASRPPARGRRRLEPVGQPVERVQAVHARPRARARAPRTCCGAPPRAGWSAPTLSPATRSARVRPARLAAATPCPGVAARPAESRRRVVGHRRAPVARHAEHAAPGVLDPGAGGGGEQPPQHPGQRGHRGRVGLPRWSVAEANRYGTPRPPSAIRPSAVRCAYM